MKILFPNNIYLLRGNHEDLNYQVDIYNKASLPQNKESDSLDKNESAPDLKAQMTFYKEVKEKYATCDQNTLEKLGENICKFYNSLSLAAVVSNNDGNKFLCIHGGIPNLNFKIEENTRNIKKPINLFPGLTPSNMLWNQRCEIFENTPINSYLRAKCFNKSQRGPRAKVFNFYHLHKFLEENSLDFMVSGHVHYNSVLNFCLSDNPSAPIHITLTSTDIHPYSTPSILKVSPKNEFSFQKLYEESSQFPENSSKLNFKFKVSSLLNSGLGPIMVDNFSNTLPEKL